MPIAIPASFTITCFRQRAVQLGQVKHRRQPNQCRNAELQASLYPLLPCPLRLNHHSVPVINAAWSSGA